MGRLTKTPRLLIFLAFSASAGVTPADYEEAYRLREAGEILPLAEILEAQVQHRPGKVLEVELERKGGRLLYEIQVLDEAGTVWELYYDAVSGALVEQGPED
jgi:uncharacterized membrane protein YkoI